MEPEAPLFCCLHGALRRGVQGSENVCHGAQSSGFWGTGALEPQLIGALEPWNPKPLWDPVFLKYIIAGTQPKALSE